MTTAILPFGISVQEASYPWSQEKEFIIVKFDNIKTEFHKWDNKTWIEDPNKATRYKVKLDAENRAYSMHEGFKVGDYKLVGLSAGLYPCAIKYHDTYLKKFEKKKRDEFYEFVKRYKTKEYEAKCEFTTEAEDAMKFNGPQEALETMKFLTKRRWTE